MARASASLLLALALTAVAPASLSAADKEATTPPTSGLPKVAEKVTGLTARPGLLATYLDPAKGKVWVELPAPGPDGVVTELLYVEGLLTGLGSNPVGLDRGQLGAARVVRVRRLGTKVLIEEPNLAFRALSQDPEERRTVAQSFASSVLWGGEIAALDADGKALLDLTPFVVRDAHGVARTLQQTGQGSWSLDEARSALDPSGCLSFPDNIELEAVLTFAGQEPGDEVQQTAPQAQSITLVQHHSLIRLPDAGYRPRRFDPRSGSFAISFADYAAPLGQPIDTRWVVRHRLQHQNPGDPSSPAVEPIVYYVDSGAPEPIRSALVDGVKWWEEAFAKAGFPGAFKVELLPKDAHPLDVRYNVVQWVHRATRGWSYGGGVIDPRTGEMLKGHVTLGSLRVRQDILIFEGLLGTEKTGTGASDDPVQLSLARIRQLAAHEVGHTLGLDHNFAASTYGGRASVMDYPAPLVRAKSGANGDGQLDVSQAYGVGVGAWDAQAIEYAYREFATPEAESSGLGEILSNGIQKGLRHLSDADARPAGAAAPVANLWDNGTDVASELDEVMKVRRIALDRFGERNIAAGRPLANLQEVLAPIYFWHRYQVDATVKAIGGIDYGYAARGDALGGAKAIPAELQRRALAELLSALAPAELDLSDSVIRLLLPRASGYNPNREMFRGQTGLTFDPLAAAASGADLVLANLLQAERLNRVVDQHRRDAAQPSLEEVLAQIEGAVFTAKAPTDARQREIARVVQRVAADRLVGLAADAATPYPVRLRVEAELTSLVKKLKAPAAGQVDAIEATHRSLLAADLQRYLERREWQPTQLISAPALPPGSPIGGMGSAPIGGAPMGGAPMGSLEGGFGADLELTWPGIAGLGDVR